jgi:serine/tyrosine/threonine adenylyltransferase
MFQIDNQFTTSFSANAVADGPTRQVPEAFAWVQATPVAAPRLLAHSPQVAALLGLGAEQIQGDEFLQTFAGNRGLAGSRAWAYNYGGHQFGHWAGQLGDGRALSLAEVIASDGSRLELQLKGAGTTPFSRHADGRAVLRSSLREFVCSEAMHHLGIPTTRALSLITTGEDVERDMFYNGNRKLEPGAIVCRVAPSFLRFGHFELPAARNDQALLRQLVDFCIQRDFPELQGNYRIADWFAQVCERTALMVAHWMRVGFVHGVMNTDNMSILGLTLDYGPYGWLEPFDVGWTPNTTDAQGKRYCFGRQPEIAHWNLGALASAIAPLFEDQSVLQEALQIYAKSFNAHHQRMNIDKLGFEQWRDDDAPLLSEFYRLMEEADLDFSLSFRALQSVATPSAVDDSLSETIERLAACSDAPARAMQMEGAMCEWLHRYQQRVSALDQADRIKRMSAANPIYVPRNYLAQLAIDAAEQGDVSVLHEWMTVLEKPYIEQAGKEKFAAKRPEWARQRAGCSMLSCSS